MKKEKNLRNAVLETATKGIKKVAKFGAGAQSIAYFYEAKIPEALKDNK